MKGNGRARSVGRLTRARSRVAAIATCAIRGTWTGRRRGTRRIGRQGWVQPPFLHRHPRSRSRCRCRCPAPHPAPIPLPQILGTREGGAWRGVARQAGMAAFRALMGPAGRARPLAIAAHRPIRMSFRNRRRCGPPRRGDRPRILQRRGNRDATCAPLRTRQSDAGLARARRSDTPLDVPHMSQRAASDALRNVHAGHCHSSLGAPASEGPASMLRRIAFSCV